MGSEEPIEILLNEVQHFILASHLFWGIWSIVNSRMSKIKFGYRVNIYRFYYILFLESNLIKMDVFKKKILSII